MAILNDLTLDIQRAYHLGKAGTGEPYNEDKPELLEQIQQLDHGIQPQERVVKDLCFELLRTAVAKIRQGELTSVEGLIQTMNGLIENSDLSPDSRSFCKSYIEAAAAYLDYKCQRYDRAMERLRETLAIDEYLEHSNPDFHYMHLHRIMLLDNWVRVKAHQGQVLAAIDLSFQILDYLERKIVSLPVPTTWDSSLLAAYPADIVSIYFRTITSQIAEAVTGKDQIEGPDGVRPVRDLFTHACHHLSGGNCYLSRASHDWMQLKLAALDDNQPAFLHYAMRLLAAGPGKIPTLWYATIVEVIIMSQRWSRTAGAELAPARSDAFLEELMQEIMAWRRLPSTWKAVLTSERR
jgi:hypothetical protein